MQRDPKIPTPDQLTKEQLFRLAVWEYSDSPSEVVETILWNIREGPVTFSLEDQRDYWKCVYEDDSTPDEDLLTEIKRINEEVERDQTPTGT